MRRTTIDFFDIYTQKLGWKVIPLLPNSKQPFHFGWNRHYAIDVSRDQILKRCCNIGLLLGDVIDVEGDSPHANSLIDRLVGDYPHPRYRSAKSVHHLFLTPDPALTRIVVHGMEFRGRLHQSVLPPSVVKDVPYKWLEVGHPPELPDSLRNLFNRYFYKRAVRKDATWCVSCGNKVFVDKKKLFDELQEFRQQGKNWQCRKCKNVQ